MDLGLKGKVVVVTGSSRGIGRSVALAFAREGASIVVTGRTPSAVEETAGVARRLSGDQRVFAFPGDLRDEATVRTCLERTVSQWKRLDVLVANIGTGRGRPGWETTEEDWASLFDTNLFSAVRCARAAIPHLVSSGGGSIVFVASIAGLEHLGAPAAYEAAKAGVLAHSKFLARALAPRRIRSNVVAPGNILFPGGSWAERLEKDRAGTLATIEREVPANRFGDPDEVANAVLFLASDAVSSFTTGACLVVDGGQTRAFS